MRMEISVTGLVGSNNVVLLSHTLTEYEIINLTFRRLTWHGWISISRMIISCTLGIPIIVRTNSHGGNRPPSSVKFINAAVIVSNDDE